MSSATSIRRSFRDQRSFRLKAGPTGEGPEPDGAAGSTHASRHGFRPWHFFVLASLAAATAAVILSRQSAPAHLILISLTIGATGAAAAAFYRTIAPLALRDVSVLSARPSERARATLEREKALVLRSIKELEFDRAMGKLSAKDFDEMAGRLRARAIALMRQLDAGGSGYRELIERELRMRVNSPASASNDVGIDDVASGPVAAASDSAAAVSSSVGAPRRSCAACTTLNDADAAFCKRCGTSLAAVH